MVSTTTTRITITADAIRRMLTVSILLAGMVLFVARENSSMIPSSSSSTGTSSSSWQMSSSSLLRNVHRTLRELDDKTYSIDEYIEGYNNKYYDGTSSPSDAETEEETSSPSDAETEEETETDYIITDIPTVGDISTNEPLEDSSSSSSNNDKTLNIVIGLGSAYDGDDQVIEDIRADATENYYGPLPVDDEITDDMIMDAKDFMADGSVAPSIMTDQPFDFSRTEVPVIPTPEEEYSDDEIDDDEEEKTQPKQQQQQQTQGENAEQKWQDWNNKQSNQNKNNGAAANDSPDEFSAALLFTNEPTDEYWGASTGSPTSEYGEDVYPIDTKVVKNTDTGWKSGIVQWYDSDSDNYGVLWLQTEKTQIFGSGKDMNEMVRMGRNDELFSMGKSDNGMDGKSRDGDGDDADKGTIIGLTVMGVAMVALVAIAAIVLRRRSSKMKKGQSANNDNNDTNLQFRDHDEEFHDEPAKYESAFKDNPDDDVVIDEKAKSSSPSEFYHDDEPVDILTVEGQIIEDGIVSPLGDPTLFPDNPDLYQQKV